MDSKKRENAKESSSGAKAVPESSSGAKESSSGAIESSSGAKESSSGAKSVPESSSGAKESSSGAIESSRGAIESSSGAIESSSSAKAVPESSSGAKESSSGAKESSSGAIESSSGAKAVPESSSGAKAVPESSSGAKEFSSRTSQFGIPSLLDNPNDFLTFCALHRIPHGVLTLISEHGANVNYENHLGGGTALHLAACIGSVEVAEVLIQLGANINAIDKEGDTPLAKALRYDENKVAKLLVKHGAKRQDVFIYEDIINMFLELEIDSTELYFKYDKGIIVGGKWLKLPVTLGIWEEDAKVKTYMLRAFRDEVLVLRQIRHPNIAMFFGIVVRSRHYPMMIVTEYFPKGDLRDYLRHKGSLGVRLAVRFALDIARGMNYLHEHKPNAIVLRNLEPAYIFMDDAGNLKVANFSSSKLLKESDSLKEGGPYSTLDIDRSRYMAPELFHGGEYNTKVDVFSFSLVLYEMIEGHRPLPDIEDLDVQQAYAQNTRPDFNDMSNYLHGLFTLINECWSSDPAERPTFRDIILRLTYVENKFAENNSRNKKQGGTTAETSARKMAQAIPPNEPTAS